MRAVTMVVAVMAAAWMSLDAQAPNPNQLFIRALTGVNATNTSSVVYAGSGRVAVGGGSAAPVTRYTVAINYVMGSSRVEIERPSSPKRVTQFFADDTAWDVVDGGQPRRVSDPERRRFVAMTPHGALKAAFDPSGKREMAAVTGADGQVVTTMTYRMGSDRYRATLDATPIVTRVETLDATPAVQVVYGDYRDFGGIKFPMRITETRGGQTVVDVTLIEVRPNAGLYLEPPAGLR